MTTEPIELDYTADAGAVELDQLRSGLPKGVEVRVKLRIPEDVRYGLPHRGLWASES